MSIASLSGSQSKSGPSASASRLSFSTPFVERTAPAVALIRRERLSTADSAAGGLTRVPPPTPFLERDRSLRDERPSCGLAGSDDCLRRPDEEGSESRCDVFRCESSDKGLSGQLVLCFSGS